MSSTSNNKIIFIVIDKRLLNHYTFVFFVANDNAIETAVSQDFENNSDEKSASED